MPANGCGTIGWRNGLGRLVLAVACLAGLTAAPARAQDATNLFRGKTVRVIVGASAGGGFDIYSRIIAEHLGKHLPGRPTVIVQNMVGAGSLTAANYIANVAPKDGTVIGAVNPLIVTNALFYPERFKFDARKVKWIGSALRETHVAMVSRKSQVQNFADLFRRELVVAGSGGATNSYPMLLNAVLGTHFKVVSGYAGTAEGNLAMERGEVDGVGGITWASVKATHAEALRDKNLRILVQYGLAKHKELPGVPWVFDYAKSDADRAALRLLLSTQEFGRPYLVAEGVPDAVVSVLRDAFDATMKATDFRVEAGRRGLDLDPTTGGDIQNLVDNIYKTPPPVVARVRKVLENTGGN
jgi:tripartite-type tricarboxylate transporter receptor subunit TctC